MSTLHHRQHGARDDVPRKDGMKADEGNKAVDKNSKQKSQYSQAP